MRKFAKCGVMVLCGAAITMAAMPQASVQVRKPLKYGDRCTKWIGEEFYLDLQASVAIMRKDGDYKLVAIGLDYAQFESEDYRAVLPLSTLCFRVTKK